MKKLFITGTARGGTSVISKMLNTNTNVGVINSAYLEIFRLYRNAIIRKMNKRIDIDTLKNKPFSDYYYNDKSIKTLDYILNFSSDINVDKNFWKIHETYIKKRLSIENKDLIKGIRQIYSNKISKIFNNCFTYAAKKRRLKNKKVLGILDHWQIELFKPLAKLFSDAKFIVIVRDPRASMLSNLAVKKKSWIANPMSFVRNWRKMIDILIYYQSLKIFKGRLYILKFENIAKDPLNECKKLCKFLKVPFQKNMINTKIYKDESTGKMWTGNSSFIKKAMGFSISRNYKWKKKINKKQLNSVNFIAYHHLKTMGYVTKKFNIKQDIKKNINFFLNEYNKKRNWHTNSGNVELDIGAEIFKNIFINNNKKNQIINKKLLRRFFLFEKNLNFTLNKKLFS